MRRHLHRMAAIGGVALMLLAAPGQVLAARQEAKPLAITTSTTLQADWSGEVVIAADGVTLDCAGFRIVGGGKGTGITVDGRTGVTIRNCEVLNFAQGIRVATTTESSFDYNWIHDIGFGSRAVGLTVGFGLWVVGSHGNTFAYNTVEAVLADGIDVFNATSNVFERNWVGRAGLAGWFLGNGATENTFEENESWSNGASGFIIADGASGNTFTGNGAHQNAWAGFGIDGNMHPVVDNVFVSNTATQNGDGFAVARDSFRNTLLSNVSTGNSRAGFLLSDGPSENTLTGNEGSDNGVVGFATVDYSSSNLFDGNAACRNPYFDAYQDSTSVNTWTDNTFCTEFGF